MFNDLYMALKHLKPTPGNLRDSIHCPQTFHKWLAFTSSNLPAWKWNPFTPGFGRKMLNMVSEKQMVKKRDLMINSWSTKSTKEYLGKCVFSCYYQLRPQKRMTCSIMFTIFIEKKRWFPSGFFLWIPISRTLRRGFSWKATKLRWMRFSNSLSWSQQWLVMDGQIYQQHHVDEGTWFQYVPIHVTPHPKFKDILTCAQIDPVSLLQRELALENRRAVAPSLLLIQDNDGVPITSKRSKVSAAFDRPQH